MDNAEQAHRENLPEFMTVAEVAKILKITTRTVYRYIEDEKDPLPVVYLKDRTIRIPWEQFNLWLDSRQEGGEKI